MSSFNRESHRSVWDQPQLRSGTTMTRSNLDPTFLEEFEIEDKLFRFRLHSRNLQITQFKGRRCDSIWLGLEATIWLRDSLHTLLSSTHVLPYTRYESGRTLKLFFQSNRFGVFFSLVELRDGCNTTLIVPEGWSGEGFFRFDSAAHNAIERLKEFGPGLCEKKLDPDWSNGALINSVFTDIDSGVPVNLDCSISQELFRADLDALSEATVEDGAPKTSWDSLIKEIANDSTEIIIDLLADHIFPQGAVVSRNSPGLSNQSLLDRLVDSLIPPSRSRRNPRAV